MNYLQRIQKITIVGFEFKRERFVKHHLQQALLFPENRINYIGNSLIQKILMN